MKHYHSLCLGRLQFLSQLKKQWSNTRCEFLLLALFLCSGQLVYAKAKPLLFETVEGRRLKLGNTHPHTKESWNHLIALYEAWNKPEKAEEWRAKLEQIEDFKR